MSYDIFVKYAQEALQNVAGKAMAVAGALPASIENARRIQDLYIDPETAHFSPELASQSVVSTLATAPGISESLDRALQDPRVVNYFMLFKDQPKVRMMLYSTGMAPIANEIEDRLNRARFERQRALVKQQLEEAGTGMRSRADEAAEQAAAIEEYRNEYNRLARLTGDRTDPHEVLLRVASSRGAGTHQRLSDIKKLTEETMSKPGLHIIHKNLNLARRRELDRKLRDKSAIQEQVAQTNYEALGRLGELYQGVSGMTGPETVNKTPRLNLQKLRSNISANLEDQRALTGAAAKNAGVSNHNVFDMLIPVGSANVGRHKRTQMYIRRQNNEDGGLTEYIRERVRTRFRQENQYPKLNNAEDDTEGAPLITLVKDLHKL